MFKGLGQAFSLLKNAGAMRGKMEEMQEQLAKVRVEGTAGGGVVTAEVSGQQKLLGVRVDPDFFATGDREMLEDFVTAAVNQAMDKARAAAAEAMQNVADVPGLGDMIAKMQGNEGSEP